MKTSANGGSITSTTRSTIPQPRMPRRTQSARITDTQTIIATLPISDGCRVKKGSGIQRCEPRAAEKPSTTIRRPIVPP